MILGIVGSEKAKFTDETEAIVRRRIREAIRSSGATEVCSGECHLGGVDIWAREEAEGLKIPFRGFPPATLKWSGGYKERNIQIAEYSDRVLCFTLQRLPEGYRGMQFRLCYHCGTSEHVKSGGCWTVKYAKGIGKEGEIIVIAD